MHEEGLRAFSRFSKNSMQIGETLLDVHNKKYIINKQMNKKN